ncbi:MAG: hypothetical protein AAGE96_15060 [Cyanobacteria bacterium P01_G01_bin.19]
MGRVNQKLIVWREQRNIAGKYQNTTARQLKKAAAIAPTKIITTALVAFTSLLNFGNLKPSEAAVGPYCQFAPEEVAAKEKLLKASINSMAKETQTPAAIQEYEAILQKHAEMLRLCRSQTWPEEQAIWLRLYPCDASPGSIDYVLDRIVNLGYNKVHLEVFYDSQVLLPPGDNPTPWTSVLRSPGQENIDLLQQTIDKARQRGMEIYAWMFTMNFGYTYAQRPDRQSALARNGTGEDSLTYVHDRAQAFIDPYSRQAQIDYYELVQSVLKREPDGILFDYVRYPRGIGGQSYVHSVRDLWIYSESSLNAIYDRAGNKKGLATIKKYLEKGTITTSDLKAIDAKYPQQKNARWQGRRKFPDAKASLESRRNALKKDLWFFSVAHAAQGIIDFLSFATQPAKYRNLPAGAVFFPDANRLVGETAFDSRLQAWDKFPADLEWHPMAYAVCDGETSCITDQVSTVLETANSQTKVIPALAGAWSVTYRDHPPLEDQMEALRKATPEVNSLSHFSYAWQEPERDRQRKACNFL